FDFVQQRVIELAAQGEASFLQPREVGDEAVRRARDAADHDLGLEGMTVHAAVLVTARHTLETMGRIEAERVADFHCRHGPGGPPARAALHGMPISLWIWSESRQRGRRRQ